MSKENAMKTPRGRRAWTIGVAAVAAVTISTLSPVFGQPRASQGKGAAEWLHHNPDPPCFDNANRYVNCGNGTVTDTHTGLIWLQDAGCLGSLPWAEANQAAAALESGQCGLTDGSKSGDWRLPSNAEWQAMVDAAKNHPQLQCTNPTLTDDSGSRCFGDGTASSFLNVTSDQYWSSTSNSQSIGLLPDGSKAGTIPLSNGFLLSYFDKSCCPQRVWAVRAR
jgi:hypothetical protein